MLSKAIEKLKRKPLFFFPTQAERFKKVVIFGAGGRSLSLPDELKLYGVETLFFLDNSAAKHGMTHAGYLVKNPHDCTIGDDVAVLISSTYWEDIYTQCQGLGFPHVFFDFFYGYTSQPWGFKAHFEAFDTFYSLLADDESRHTFASFIKARSTGDLSWSSRSSYPSLLHPGVKPRKGDVILEVGAGKGGATKLFLKETGHNCTIHGLEPDPEFFEILQQQTGGYDNVTLGQLAFASKPGTLTFTKPEEGAFGGLISDNPRQEQAITMEATSVDAYCEERSLSPAFMFIGTSYSTAEILKGARQVFTRDKPRWAMPLSLYNIAGVVEFVESLDVDMNLYVGDHTLEMVPWLVLYAEIR
ncbi:FkbM family methyltransferase [Pseudodesulfovibrio sp.]|nr:FkbM family methyltransferase [Pseudodesulfovibrio sp.]